jgi:hypothetical protein
MLFAGVSDVWHCQLHALEALQCSSSSSALLLMLLHAADSSRVLSNPRIVLWDRCNAYVRLLRARLGL